MKYIYTYTHTYIYISIWKYAYIKVGIKEDFYWLENQTI